MKKFDLKKAREGADVCTFSGEEVTILSTELDDFDEYGNKTPILGIIHGSNGKNKSFHWSIEGKAYAEESTDGQMDLCMKPVKHEGWVNIFQYALPYTGQAIYRSKEEAMKAPSSKRNYIGTAKIEWEE